MRPDERTRRYQPTTMNRSPRRLAAIGLAILLIIGVGYGIVTSVGDALGTR